MSSKSSFEGRIQPKPGEIRTGRLEKLLAGGWGLVRDPNYGICFVSGALPGEQLRYRIQAAGARDYHWVELVEILEPSPQRREAPCPHYTSCGACNWQHIDYPAQLQFKQEIMLEALKRSAGLSSIDIEQASKALSPPLASPELQWNYRHKAKFHLGDLKTTESSEDSWQKIVGFYAQASKELLPVPHCRILRPALQGLVRGDTQSSALAAAQASEAGELHVLQGSELCPNFETKREEPLQLNDGELSFYWKGQPLRSQARLFFQSNALILPLFLQRLYSDVQLLQEEAKLSQLYDFYAGVGLFSLVLAELFPHESGSGGNFAVERNPQAVSYLKENLAPYRFAVKNCDVGQFLGKQELRKNSLVLLDPARAGLSKGVCKQLASSRAQYIIYISCDAVSFARDCGRLSSDFALKSWRLVDFYPQTHHIEVYAILQRRA